MQRFGRRLFLQLAGWSAVVATAATRKKPPPTTTTTTTTTTGPPPIGSPYRVGYRSTY